MPACRGSHERKRRRKGRARCCNRCSPRRTSCVSTRSMPPAGSGRSETRSRSPSVVSRNSFSQQQEDMDRQHAAVTAREHERMGGGPRPSVVASRITPGAIDESIVLATAAQAVAGQAMAIRSASKAVEDAGGTDRERSPPAASQPNTITSTSQAEPHVPPVSTTANAAAPSNGDAPPATPGEQSIAGTVETEQGTTHHVDSSTSRPASTIRSTTMSRPSPPRGGCRPR